MDLTKLNFADPFGEKEQPQMDEKELKQYERDTLVTEQATHPQSSDEQMWLDKQNQIAEIRKWLLDLEPKFNRTFEEMSGYRFGDDGKPVKIPFVFPLMSINGAYQLINYVKILDQNVMRSNYSELRINQNLRYGLGFPIISFIKCNYRELGIKKNFGSLNYIINYLFNLTEPTYLHALNDGERRHESQINKVIETKNVMPEKEKKGIWSKN